MAFIMYCYCCFGFDVKMSRKSRLSQMIGHEKSMTLSSKPHVVVIFISCRERTRKKLNYS